MTRDHKYALLLIFLAFCAYAWAMFAPASFLIGGH